MSDNIATALAPDHVRALQPYQPGKPIEELERELGIRGAIKIASNENPMGPSPLAVAAAKEAIEAAHMYPDGGAFALRAALATELGVGGDELVFGAGSNELIYLVLHAFCRPGDKVVAHRFAFISYKLAALSQNLRFVEAEVTEELSCDVDALLAAAGDDAKVVFLANPNNPTGAHLGSADFERLLAGLPDTTLLVVDEAYSEYAARMSRDYPSSQTYRQRRPLTVTLRTFSKIYGLSGLRVGYGIAHPSVCDLVNRVRRPFNVSSVAQAAARAALADTEHVERSCAAAREGIAALSRAVADLGLRAYPSLGNFVLVGLGREAAPVYDQLLRQGVIVRPMGAWGLPEHVRISVGTPEQTERVVAALQRLEAGGS